MEIRVDLERGHPRQRYTLEQMMQLYMHDFSDFLELERRQGLMEDGRLPPFPHLDAYWIEPDRTVWFIRVGGQLAGFALINRHSHSHQTVDFNVGEFFVARPYRGSGVGAQAVVKLLNTHPGVWEAAIAQRNKPAQVFWPKAVALANVESVEMIDGDGVEWTGPILRCRVKPTGA